MLIIRAVQEDDAEEFLTLSNRLDEETAFRLLEPGERLSTIEQQREIISRVQSTDNHAIFVAELNGQLVGYIAAIGGKYRRNKHGVHVVVAVLQRFAGLGIGTKLFEELEMWAHGHGIHRLELTVMVHNERAIGLYKKLGFEVEGRKRHALLVSGSYVDEYCMSKLLP
jgi:RimJ/RimL family protein N-acetyltransferase